MLINADFSQVPDVRTVVRAGIYAFRIDATKDVPPKDPKTQGTNVVLDVTIVAPETSPDIGARMTHYVFIPADSQRKDAYTGIKRVFMSAGLPVNGPLNTAHLPGRTIVGLVTNGTRKDEQSGLVKETYQISDIYIPSDNIKLGETPGPSQVLGGVPGMAPPQAPQVQQPTAGVHPSMMPQQQAPAPQYQQPQPPPPAPAPAWQPPGVQMPTSIPPQVQPPQGQPGMPAFPGMGIPQQ